MENNKTLVFKSYSDFLNRENKDVNGVSEQFAKTTPEYVQDNKTNKACWNCSDCSDCSDCSSCSDCISCRFCSSCSDCRLCSSCSDCRFCSDCSDCSSCSDCRFCSSCSDCRFCSSCSDCRNFKSNPQRIVSPVLGSRNSQTTYYWNAEHEQVVSGCFKGTLKEFKEAVKETHGNRKHGKEYKGWIKGVEAYKKAID